MRGRVRFETRTPVSCFLNIALFSVLPMTSHTSLLGVVSYTTFKIPLLKTAQVSKLPYIFKSI